jgi:hypothetical protein
MRSAHESFLLAEARERVAEGERRARLEWGLADLQRSRPTLRQRAAGLLVALAHRLSPEVVPTAEPTPESCAQA